MTANCEEMRKAHAPSRVHNPTCLLHSATGGPKNGRLAQDARLQSRVRAGQREARQHFGRRHQPGLRPGRHRQGPRRTHCQRGREAPVRGDAAVEARGPRRAAQERPRGDGRGHLRGCATRRPPPARPARPPHIRTSLTARPAFAHCQPAGVGWGGRSERARAFTWRSGPPCTAAIEPKKKNAKGKGKGKGKAALLHLPADKAALKKKFTPFLESFDMLLGDRYGLASSRAFLLPATPPCRDAAPPSMPPPAPPARHTPAPPTLCIVSLRGRHARGYPDPRRLRASSSSRACWRG